MNNTATFAPPRVVPLHIGHARELARAAAIASCLVLLAGGCTKPQPPNIPVTPPSDEVFSSPLGVTRAVLECIRDKKDAVAAGDKTEARRCDERLLMLAAVDDIARRMAANPIFKIIVGDHPVEGYVALWGPTIAFYADGIDLEHLTAASSSTDTNKVVVYVPATGLDGQTVTLLVTCVRGPAGKWGVSRIDFAPAGQKPTTRPASQPAPPA